MRAVSAVLSAAAFVLGAASCEGAASPRRVGWWWDAPATADDPAVDALLAFSRNHTSIVSSILMRCGPTTLNGTVGSPPVALLPSCARAIPALAKLGIGSELWLGETDSSTAALKLFDTAPGTVKALVALGKAHPGIVGYNFDLEVGGHAWCPKGNSCSESYAIFLQTIKKGLVAAGCPAAGCPRVTVDAACSASSGWSGAIADCRALAAGADLFMNMGTCECNFAVSVLPRSASNTAIFIVCRQLGLLCIVAEAAGTGDRGWGAAEIAWRGARLLGRAHRCQRIGAPQAAARSCMEPQPGERDAADLRAHEPLRPGDRHVQSVAARRLSRTVLDPGAREIHCRWRLPHADHSASTTARAFRPECRLPCDGLGARADAYAGQGWLLHGAGR